jgi:hypothetical protein
VLLVLLSVLSIHSGQFPPRQLNLFPAIQLSPPPFSAAAAERRPPYAVVIWAKNWTESTDRSLVYLFFCIVLFLVVSF